MTCDHCEHTVARVLRSVPGVREVVEVSYPGAFARVTADAGATPANIESAVSKAGYRARVRTSTEPPAAAIHSGGDGDYDLIIIGGGSAGFAAAIKGADLGARVALIEGGTLGGTCVNVGCVPSKTLIRAAEAQHRRAHHGFDGIATSDGAPAWAAVRHQKDELVAELRQLKYSNVLMSYPSVRLLREKAELVDGHTVRLGSGQVIAAGKIVVATGASPWAPAIQGLADAGYLNSDSAMALNQLPASLVVIGGSAVGLELGQMFARLHVQVTILEAMPHVAAGEDADIGTALAGYLAAEGIEVHTGVEIERVSRDSAGYSISFSEGGTSRAVQAEQLLVATGRRANSAGFGLHAAGVRVGKKGEILVDEFLQTDNPAVYAAGDVIGDPMFVYVAAYGGALAAENALTGSGRPYDLAALPRVSFTDPAVASVGLSADGARERDIEPLVTQLPLEHVPRSLAARDTRGFVKLVADARSRKIIGAHILAAEAGEMITEPALAIKYGLTIENLASTFHPYLTLSEGIKLAAQTFNRDVSKLSCCAA
jgi:mercuric reductase